MNKFLLIVSSFLIIIFSGCSTKKVYEPVYVDADWSHYGDSNNEIIDVGSNVAHLEDGTVLAKDGIVDININEQERVISDSNGWIISSKIDGNLTISNIQNPDNIILFELKKTIASASVKDDILAVLFADSEMALYNINTKALILKEQGSKSLAVDSRIATPHFMNNLVLFSTLDGKVVIINTEKKKKLRTIIVSSEDNFNNIIYFNVIDNKIIAATGTKILSLASKEIRVKYEIRDMVYDQENIFISTKQGEVISLTPDMQVNAKIKFPFAHFLGMISYEDKLYLLEKEGYLIVLEKDLYDYTVHEVDIEDGYIFVGDKTFYIADEYISVD